MLDSHEQEVAGVDFRNLLAVPVLIIGSKLSGSCKNIYITNNNLCKTISITRILSFLLGINTKVSYLQRITLKN